MSSIYSSEDIFTAGWNAAHDNIADNPRDAYTSFRYKQLKDNEGLDSANEFAKQRAATKPENLKCPDCDGEMLPRKSIHGKFWGCKDYPRCKGTRDSNGESKGDIQRRRYAADPDKYEDVGPDIFKESNGTMTTFRKNK